MKSCRICTQPIIDGEDVIHDPEDYWAGIRQVHRICIWTPAPEVEPPDLKGRTFNHYHSRGVKRATPL